jgi:dephospho-CoA kinase
MRNTIVIGLTGSIAMGKSTVAAQFRALGAKIVCADSIVHQLFASDAALCSEIQKYFPAAIKNKNIDRAALGKIVFADEKKRKLLEALIHPRVIAAEEEFVARAASLGARVVVMDIPLLFETGGEARCDITVVASAPAFLQKQRALKRANMSEEKFRRILQSQMSDAEKKSRADFVVSTGLGKAYSFAQVKQIIKTLSA